MKSILNTLFLLTAISGEVHGSADIEESQASPSQEKKPYPGQPQSTPNGKFTVACVVRSQPSPLANQENPLLLEANRGTQIKVTELKPLPHLGETAIERIPSLGLSDNSPERIKALHFEQLQREQERKAAQSKAVPIPQGVLKRTKTMVTDLADL